MEYAHQPAEPISIVPLETMPLPVLIPRTEATDATAPPAETRNVDQEQVPPQATHTVSQASIPLRQFAPWNPAVDEVAWTLAAPGAMVGVVLGAFAGAGWTQAIARGLLSAIGPPLDAGPSACLAASMFVGALAGLILGALVGLGYPTDSEPPHPTLSP